MIIMSMWFMLMCHIMLVCDYYILVHVDKVVNVLLVDFWFGQCYVNPSMPYSKEPQTRKHL